MDLDYGTGDTAAVEESFEGLAALKQLKCLEVRVRTAAFEPAALLPLTSLTTLVTLGCSWCVVDDAEPGVTSVDLALCYRQVRS